jgi:hypothetical protein
MLSIGETYKIRMWEDGEDGGMITDHYHCKVIAASGTLIKIQRSSDQSLIINTASIAFVSAEPQND